MTKNDLKFHDRLDQKLQSDDYSCRFCGSWNPSTGKAEYCNYNCPTLAARMSRGEDVTVPVPPPQDDGLLAEAKVPTAHFVAEGKDIL